jgi:integrase
MTMLAPNIEKRIWGRGEKTSLRVTFFYRGARCRETLANLDPDKKKDVTYATQLLAEINRQITLGQFNYADYFPDSPNAEKYSGISKKTVKQLLESTLADFKRIALPSSYNSYVKPSKAIWIPELGDLPITSVSAEHIREIIRNKNVTIKTMRNYLLPLRLMFDNAIADELIKYSPLDRIKLSRIMPKKKTGYTVDPYTIEEIEILLNGFKQYRQGWLNYFEFQFFTGCRPSETYALNWDDVNLATGTVKISHTMVERLEQDRTKTEASEREFKLYERAALAIQRQKSVTFLANGKIFTNPRSKKPIKDYEESGRSWDYIHKKTGVRRRNQYQTRHSFASNLISQGDNPFKIAKLMGHEDRQMLFRVYAKWIELGSESESEKNYGTAPQMPHRFLENS